MTLRLIEGGRASADAPGLLIHGASQIATLAGGTWIAMTRVPRTVFHTFDAVTVIRCLPAIGQAKVTVSLRLP